MTTRLAIFDFDGTLADTWPVFTTSISTLAAKYGFRAVERDDVQRLRRLSASEIVRELELPLWRVPSVLADFRRIMQERAHEVEPFAGIDDALTSLARHNIALALVTSNSLANVNAVLGEALVDRFSAVECSSALFGKARRLRMILEQTRVDKSEAIYVGDEIRDAQAASSVGIRFGAVAWGYTSLDALLAFNPSEVFRVPADINKLDGTECMGYQTEAN